MPDTDPKVWAEVESLFEPDPAQAHKTQTAAVFVSADAIREATETVKALAIHDPVLLAADDDAILPG